MRNSKLIFLVFLIGFVVISSSFAQTGTDNKVFGFFELNGKVVPGTEVSEKEVEETYDIYLSYYGSFDPLFEEPYVKAYILNSLLQDKVKEYFAKLENLSLDEFSKQHSTISEEEMMKYYNENREQLMKDEEYVDIDYVIFETQEEAQKFFDTALKEGFQKALEGIKEATNVQSESYDGLKKSETSEIFVDTLFGKYDSKIRIQITDNGNFVFLIRNHNDFSTFDKFKESSKYAEVQQDLGNKKFEDYLNSKIATEKLKIVVPVSYSIWVDYVQDKATELLISVYYSKIFNEDKTLKTDDPWLLAGIISTMEDAKLTEKYQQEYKEAILKLYEKGYKTFSILSRLRQFDNSEKIVLEYNVELSKILLSYIKNGDINSVLRYIYNNLAELDELTNSENVQISQKAMEYLYYMYKSLGEEEVAQGYRDKLLQANPEYKFELGQ
ncbi:MAG TPA: peptidyl-prolyl cis-trans isomerase [Fervidobacterium nodosum]|nr:peptidyl-prolyl cis-trans isomerase [Fervidobacterium nodosum]